jgi:cell division septation protein DedD
VQVGSFSKQDTAAQLAKELRGQGHAAFVMPVRSGATTLHRVRIGPVQERASAEALLRKVKQERASLRDATVVSHP